MLPKDPAPIVGIEDGFIVIPDDDPPPPWVWPKFNLVIFIPLPSSLLELKKTGKISDISVPYNILALMAINELAFFWDPSIDIPECRGTAAQFAQ